MWLLDLEGLEALITFADTLNQGIRSMMLSRDTRREHRPTYATLIGDSKSIDNRSPIVTILFGENLVPTQSRVGMCNKIAGFPIYKGYITGKTIGGDIRRGVFPSIGFLQIMKKRGTQIFMIKVLELFSNFGIFEKLNGIGKCKFRDIRPALKLIRKTQVFVQLNIPGQITRILLTELKIAKLGSNESTS